MQHRHVTRITLAAIAITAAVATTGTAAASAPGIDPAAPIAGTGSSSGSAALSFLDPMICTLSGGHWIRYQGDLEWGCYSGT
ncbi:hypothetical protein AB0L82_23040 [Nocardia sp. NPDC052001]|uniref:hypothetical protein n=1 Tax=Nocardia sp. NPDC052001 TaxID=3154853 RepID=UPI003426C475